MSAVYKSFDAREVDFGASSGFYVKIEDNKVTEVLDTSSHDTNYVWDFYVDEKNYIGLSEKELSDKMYHMYDDFNDEFRHPWILECTISEDEYTSEKIRQGIALNKEKYIETMKELGAAKTALRSKQRKNAAPDLLEEKNSILNSRRMRAAPKRQDESDESYAARKARIEDKKTSRRIRAAKDFMQKHRTQKDR